MSELKRRHINEVMDMFWLTRGDMNWAYVYYADDADKVIAELETKNARLAEELNEWLRSAANRPIIIGRLRQHIAVLDNEICHHKYKLCLAMARWCENEEARLEAVAPLFDTDKECWEYNSDYWTKWRNRWLELAENFKDKEAK